MNTTRRPSSAAVPSDCWYALAPSEAVGRELLAVRAAGLPVVLYRTQAGAPVALENRCAHRAYPLSAGTLRGDDVSCGLCGFVYDQHGQCVSVPTQRRVPFGASVAAHPTLERDGLVWVWLGEPGRAVLHRAPELPWLVEDGWATVAGSFEVAAGFLLLHENFADVTQVPILAPEIAPSALAAAPPPLEVVVTETTVELRRTFPPSPMPTWQVELLGGDPGEHATVQEGYFLSPAAWVDVWDVVSDAGPVARLRFSHLVTPVDEGRSRLLWRVSRDFAIDDPAADGRVLGLFSDYYGRVTAAMETAQAALDLDGPGHEVNVAADVAGLKVRDIVLRMLAEEGVPTAGRRPRPSL